MVSFERKNEDDMSNLGYNLWHIVNHIISVFLILPRFLPIDKKEKHKHTWINELQQIFHFDEKDEKKYLTVSWWGRRITQVETPSNHFVAA